jgi:hypothetical protein
MNLSYDRLTRATLSNAPYRGSTNRFPLLTRRQNRKYFLVREEDGKKVFDIVYGQSWHSEKITKEQADALSRTSKKSLVERAGGEYLMYVTRPRIVGTVYPGETPAGEFEFNSGSYGQGDRMFLSDMFRGGWFTTNSRKGGMLYRKRMDGKSITHPIYRGMRVDAMTMRPIKPYEVVVNQVDRKKSKAVMAKYAHFFKVSEVMLKSINVGQVVEIANHLLYEGDHPMSKRFAAGALRRDTVAMCLARGEELINDAPLDAFVWFALGHEIGRILYRALGRMVGTRADDEYSAYDELFMSVKRRLVKDTYMRNPEVFKEVSYEMGADIPASDWGMKIIVDGKEVEQYA